MVIIFLLNFYNFYTVIFVPRRAQNKTVHIIIELTDILCFKPKKGYHSGLD